MVHYLRESDWDEYVKSKDGFQRAPGDPMHTSTVNDVPDDAMLDHRNVTWVIEQLQKKRDQPFFLAAGLDQAAHTVERAAQVLRPVPGREDRAAAQPAHRSRRRSTSRRAYGAYHGAG